MLNFKRKRVLNPILMLKSIILSVFIGAFTVTASLSVDAAQISLEEELAILTGQDNHSKYLPNDSEEEEEEEDCYEPSELSMMSEYIPPRAPTGGNNRNEMGSESVEERQKIDQDWEVLIFNDREIKDKLLWALASTLQIYFQVKENLMILQKKMPRPLM